MTEKGEKNKKKGRHVTTENKKWHFASPPSNHVLQFAYARRYPRFKSNFMQEALLRVTIPQARTLTSLKFTYLPNIRFHAYLPVYSREIREIPSLSVAARILEDPVGETRTKPGTWVKPGRAIIF